eukprot:PLAT7041.3.p1 GENE.PLAT7041.3~~PLAT7041.3.p1  ORF type:complete len:620 (+),score=342.19 PLAT7041.3:18-1877(+)
MSTAASVVTPRTSTLSAAQMGRLELPLSVLASIARKEADGEEYDAHSADEAFSQLRTLLEGASGHLYPLVCRSTPVLNVLPLFISSPEPSKWALTALSVLEMLLQGGDDVLQLMLSSGGDKLVHKLVSVLQALPAAAGSSGGSGGSGRRGLRSPRSSAEMEADLQSKIDAKSEHVREVGSDCMASWKEFVRAQNVYAADMKAFLESFHMDEERRVEEMRVSLRKSLVFESSLQANLQYDVQSLAAPMEAIDCHADLQAFLSSHHEELRAEGVDVDTVGRGVEMRATIDRLFHGDVPDLESYVLLRRDVRDSRDSMLDFISALDQQRGKGVYLVEDAFDMVAQLINDALSKAEETMDFSSGRALMIISQTFCKRVREESKDVDTAATAAEDATAAATAAAVAGADGSDGEQVVYLQLRIAKHSLWRNMEFWEKALFDSLSQEMSKIHKAAAEERVARESDIAFGQLGFFALNMLTFGVSEASVRKLLHKFNMVIQLDDMLWTELLANLRATAQRRRQAAAAAAREAEEAEAAAAAVDGSRPPTMPLPATPADAKTAAKKKRKKKGSKKRRKSASRPPADAADDATPPPPPPRDAAGDAAGDGSADEAASRPPPPPPRRSS